MPSRCFSRQAALVCFLVAFACGCTTSIQRSKSGKTSTPVIDLDMAEAVFRYQFENNGSELYTDASAYFLEVRKTDPEDAFINRFKGLQPPVKKKSQCSTKGMRVTDRKTGKRGLMFNVDKTAMTGADTAEAWGGYLEGELSASSNIYFLNRKNGKWSVEKDKVNWNAMTGRWKPLLTSAISGADTMTIKTGGFRLLETPHFSHTITGKKKIAEFLALIEIDEDDSQWHCECGGDGLLIFSQGQKTLCQLSYHHASSLRWHEGKWPCDARLKKDCRLPIAQWFSDLGLPQFLKWNKPAFSTKEQ